MKVGICGNVSLDSSNENGQSVKTRQFIESLKQIIGIENVEFLNTNEWVKAPFRFFLKTNKLHKDNDIIIFITASKGVRIFPKIFNFFNIFSKKKIHYIVVGGWLKKRITKNKGLLKSLKKLDGIHVETKTMKSNLESLGLNNILILENFRIEPNKTIDYIYKEDNYRFCFFSRVIERKGIEDLISVVTSINENEFSPKCFLDIYGPITHEYEEKINSIIDNKYIKYLGSIDPNDSFEVLQNYYMQIFPTKIYTEGTPGSIVEGYFAGLPVISSKWESFDDVVIDNVTGLGYELGNKSALEEKIVWAINNKDIINRMRFNCLKISKKYSADVVMENFVQYLKNGKNDF